MLRTCGRQRLLLGPSNYNIPQQLVGTQSKQTMNRQFGGSLRRPLQYHSLLSDSRFVSIQFQSSLSFPSIATNSRIHAAPQTLPQQNVPLSLLVPTHQQRPVTAWERVRYFPNNLLQLWNDYLRYRNILDAANSPRNAWTLRHHVVVDMNANVDDDSKAARIPRRQYQQLQQFQQDWQTVLPIVLLSAPPIIGYLPLIFAIVAPRQILSRQFHNEFEIWTFAQLASQRRQEHMHQLAKSQAGKDILENLHGMIFDKNESGHMDAAGPFLDLKLVYEAVIPDHGDYSMLLKGHSKASTLISCLPRRNEAKLSWSHLPREYLVQLAMANGLFQQYPGWMSKILMSAASRKWLELQLRDIAKKIRGDDIMLLEEGHDHDKCQSLTDQEVLDACLMRGLPVSVSLDEMRACLMNHLQMIKEWLDHRPPTTPNNDAAELLFLLNVTPLRNQLKQFVSK